MPLIRFTLIALLSLPAFAETSSWYSIQVANGSSQPQVYYGTSKLEIEQLLDDIEDGKIIKLEQLIWFDKQMQVKTWQAWNPNMQDVIYIRSQNILSVNPMNDPLPSVQ